jgi:tRNA_anti-like
MKAETAPRKVIFAVITAICLSSAVFWLQIKTIWPPFTDATISVGTNPVAWFVALMFILAVVAFHPAKARSRAAEIPFRDIQPTDTQEEHKQGDRVFIDVTAEFLINLYKGRTAIHGDALALTYLGKWIIVSGRIANVYRSTSGGYRVIIRCDPDDKLVTADFGENSQVAYLSHDLTITVRGKIEKIASMSIDMTECEMVKAG